MTDHFISKFILDQRNRIHPGQTTGKGGPLGDPYLNDPEYLGLYQRYISSLEAFTKALLEAIAIMNKSHLPGPRRQADFYKLDQLRRFYETDAYKYFTYHPHIKGPLPPQTNYRSGRGHLNDAKYALLLGNDTKAVDDCNRAVDETMKICHEVWERYQKSPEPKSDALKRELINALELAQVSSLEIPLIDEIQEEINRILSSESKTAK